MEPVAVEVLLLDARETPPSTLAVAEQWLGASERGRLSAMSRASRRDQFLLGRTLLRLAVARHVGHAPRSIVALEVFGRAPALWLPSGAAPWFSLSHSGHWIACAVSPAGPLGLDVEAISTQRDVLALSEWRFHAEEHAWLLRQPDRHRAFYRLWTGKEATVKLRSQLGQRADMGDVHFEIAGDALCPPPPAASEHQLPGPPDVAVSVVTNFSSQQPRLRFWPAADLAERVRAADCH